MYRDSLVAINIYSKESNKLYNKSLVPLLFYWNGNGELIETILKDNKIVNEYLNTIFDYEEFLKIKMSYFYFKINDNDEEEYIDNTILISNYINLKDFNSDQIIYSLSIPYFYELYEKAIGNKYEKVNVFNKEIILDIYKQIKEKYQEKLYKKTFVNYIRSRLIDQKNISSDNINFIIKQINQILENES